MTPTLEDIQLKKGVHDSPEQGMCAMEAAAYIAGEPHSDHPQCVSPVLAAFLRDWNDALEADFRQKLKPFIPRVIGTAGDGKDEARKWLATDWLVRVYAPAWLDLAGLTQHATVLRAADVIRDGKSAEAVRPALAGARDTARAAAGIAAWDAARAAAGIAAWDAAGAAAWAAAAGAAAGAAAAGAAAAGAAAAGAAAAGAAARASLQPTVESLQASALDLLDRMITGVAA